MPSHKQRSFFFALEDEASKKGQGLAHQALAPGPRLERTVDCFCAIHKVNVAVALLFQTLIELKRKRAASRYVTARRIMSRTSAAAVTDDY